MQLSHRHRHAERGGSLQRHRHRGTYLAHGRLRRALADAAGWSPEQSDLLELAAPMHDMGKIGIPDHILKKPGPLTEEEWVIMRSHPRIGYEILRRSDAPIFRMAAEIALHHHEKWDGSGYPAGETGEGSRGVADRGHCRCV
ncbi:HD-GYP domain-containing protein [Aeromonas caviae]|uniref:HD-GYP domain-containing protein n=1 Tax=Aeromonas caviae TaxID=648 RepID=UPI001F4E968E|nr:HD domain-containing phosphohydrolase [Aeromonas caviae]